MLICEWKCAWKCLYVSDQQLIVGYKQVHYKSNKTVLNWISLRNVSFTNKWAIKNLYYRVNFLIRRESAKCATFGRLIESRWSLQDGRMTTAMVLNELPRASFHILGLATEKKALSHTEQRHFCSIRMGQVQLFCFPYFCNTLPPRSSWDCTQW